MQRREKVVEVCESVSLHRCRFFYLTKKKKKKKKKKVGKFITRVSVE